MEIYVHSKIKKSESQLLRLKTMFNLTQTLYNDQPAFSYTIQYKEHVICDHSFANGQGSISYYVFICHNNILR